jgi:hypothetical protein
MTNSVVAFRESIAPQGVCPSEAVHHSRRSTKVTFLRIRRRAMRAQDGLRESDRVTWGRDEERCDLRGEDARSIVVLACDRAKVASNARNLVTDNEAARRVYAKDRKPGTVPIGGECLKAFTASDPGADYELADNCAPDAKFGGQGAAKGAYCAFGYCTHACSQSSDCSDLGASATCNSLQDCKK